MKRLIFLCACSALLWASTAGSASAEILFESGRLGATGIAYGDLGGGVAPESSGVTHDVYSGVRFQLLQPAVTTRVGGHFVDDPRTDNSFFGAIVRLNDDNDFPNSLDLSTSDVAGAATLALAHPSAEVFGDLTVELDPGWYALVFGSGLFGATGSGAAVLNNPDIGSPSYIALVPGSGWIEIAPPFGPFESFRLVLEGYVVAEPHSAISVLLFTCCLCCCRRAKRYHCFAP